MEEATTILEEIDDAAAPETAPTAGGDGDLSRREVRRAAERLGALESELDDVLSRLESLTDTVEKLARRTRGARDALMEELGDEVPAARRSRGRRSGRGRPDTIVEACRKILEAAEEPMKVAEITDRVLEMGLDIKAKNPNVTVSSILSSYEIFSRVRRGYYELAG